MKIWKRKRTLYRGKMSTLFTPDLCVKDRLLVLYRLDCVQESEDGVCSPRDNSSPSRRASGLFGRLKQRKGVDFTGSTDSDPPLIDSYRTDFGFVHPNPYSGLYVKSIKSIYRGSVCDSRPLGPRAVGDDSEPTHL